MNADRRRLPARPDLAARQLEGKVEAARFVDGRPSSVIAAVASLKPEPRSDVGMDTQVLFGQSFTVYDVSDEGWSWGQLGTDSYVGWVPTDALGQPVTPTHRLATTASFVYPAPNMKLPALMRLSMGALLRLEEPRGAFARAVGAGWVFTAHCLPVGAKAADFVTVAERFLNVPYLWGGKTSSGLDCSGLVQVALGEAGIAAPRDSDMQAAELGLPLNVAPDLSGLRRGDLVFWRGHVGILRDAATLLHANAHHMAVASEPLAGAVARIEAAGGGPITGARRLA